jgi:hypothetical protein
MYSVELSVSNLDESASTEFESAVSDFLAKLGSVADLRVEIPSQRVQGTRGELPLLAGIIVTGIEIGAFTAIYTLAKDLFSLCANAEVQLSFEDGSSITLKHLAQREAEAILQEHLRRKNLGRASS